MDNDYISKPGSPTQKQKMRTKSRDTDTNMKYPESHRTNKRSATSKHIERHTKQDTNISPKCRQHNTKQGDDRMSFQNRDVGLRNATKLRNSKSPKSPGPLRKSINYEQGDDRMSFQNRDVSLRNATKSRNSKCPKSPGPLRKSINYEHDDQIANTYDIISIKQANQRPDTAVRSISTEPS